MPFTDHTEYPRGLAYAEFFAPGEIMTFPSGALKMNSFWLDNIGGADSLIFRRPSAGAEYFRFPIAASKRYAVPCRVEFVDGLEIAFAGAAADVSMTVSYFSG